MELEGDDKAIMSNPLLKEGIQREHHRQCCSKSYDICRSTIGLSSLHSPFWGWNQLQTAWCKTFSHFLLLCLPPPYWRVLVNVKGCIPCPPNTVFLLGVSHLSVGKSNKTPRMENDEIYSPRRPKIPLCIAHLKLSHLIYLLEYFLPCLSHQKDLQYFKILRIGTEETVSGKILTHIPD